VSFLYKIPIVKQLIGLVKSIQLPWLQGLSLYELLELYITGIVKGAFSYRASAIAFSFFMALFPFALFILNLIPYIPIDDFQSDFMAFIENSVPPTTFDAIQSILLDILNNSYKGLLSSGVILSVFLMTNGVNAILGGFESSYHITNSRGFIRQYLWALGISIVLSLLLLFTVAIIIVFEVLIQSIDIPDTLHQKISFLQIGRVALVVLMILITVSILFKYGIRMNISKAFFNIGSVYTTILIVLTSYLFGIYVVKFAKYNELYGSIGTFLILMFYIWINCMILLSGFELNATIYNLKQKNLQPKKDLPLT